MERIRLLGLRLFDLNLLGLLTGRAAVQRIDGRAVFLDALSGVFVVFAHTASDTGPAEFGGSPEIAAEAFKLNEQNPLSDAVSAPTGAVVLIFKDLQPSRTPLLSEVREKVSADYIDGEKRKSFVELGRKIRSTIEQRIKAGDAFDKAVAAAAGANSVKIESKLLSPFTRRQPPQDIDYSVFGALPKLEKGNLSDMITTRDHGLIVYAADKKLPEIDETSPQFTEARQQIAMASSRMGSSAY